MPDLHEDELPITVELVRALLARDAPELAALPLRPVAASGSTNVLFRLGDELAVRLPRQTGGSAGITAEARWQPIMARDIGVDVPEIVAVGEPGLGYPERWAITRWIRGDTPDVPPRGDVRPLALDLARVLSTWRATPVPPEALTDPALRSYRAGSPADVAAPIRGYLQQCRELADRGVLDLDVDACARVWDEALRLPPPLSSSSTAPAPAWVHGDLLAENLLVRAGRLHAVLDFGAAAVGDASVDLVIAWEALDAPARRVFREALDLEVDDPRWLRGRAWALAISIMTFGYYWDSMPGRCRDRLVMARAVLEDVRTGT